MTATISICIPCYNSEKYIRTTIESVLCQSEAATEVLISDDRSPDRSFDIVKEYAGLPRVRILRPPERTSLGGHYRFLLEQATSDYVCFLSSDDALMPHFVATMQRELKGEQNIGMIAAACLECDAMLVPTRLRGGGLPKETFLPPAGFYHFKRGNTYTISVALWSRAILMATPPIPSEADLITDWCWALLVGARGKIKFVREPLGYYRIHTTNAGHLNNDKWQIAAAHMLRFLVAYLEPELTSGLHEIIERIEARIKKGERGEPKDTASARMRDKLKNYAKSLIALRYRSLHPAIRQAERGISAALEGARPRP